MKALFTLFSIVLVSLVNAQSPVLTKANMVPLPNDIFEKYVVDTTNVTIGSSGSNYTWDYSSLKVSSTLSKSFYIEPDESGYFSSFPEATLANGQNGNFSFYITDENQYTCLGFVDPTSVIVYSDPEIWYKFPFTFNDEFIDSFYGSYSYSGQNFISKGFRSVKADGWGTLKLPLNTYNNTIRLLIKEHMVDSTFGFSFIVDATTSQWYDGVNKTPLLSITDSKITSSSNPTPLTLKVVRVASFTGSDISENNSNVNFELVPNPASDELNIRFESELSSNLEIEIINTLGQVQKTLYSGQSSNSIFDQKFNISDLLAGIYLVKITNGKTVMVKQLSVK